MTDDGNFKVGILVEGVLIARGEGKTPIVAQEAAMQDFVDRLEVTWTSMVHILKS